jgi:ribosome-associated protein
MARTTKAKEIELLVATIIHGIQERKGKNIVTMDLRNIPNTVCDFFVICTGDSNTHVEGISGSIQETTKKELTDRPWHVEGMGNSEWVLLDYVNVVVHVFQREPRDFYNIERLWADAIVTEHAEDGTTLVLPQIPKRIPVKKEKKAKPTEAKKSETKKSASKARTPKSASARPKAVAKAQTEGVKEYKGRVKAKPRTAASTTGAKTVEVTFTEVKPRAKAAAKPRTRESAPRSASTAKPETRNTTSRAAVTAKPKATAAKPKAVEAAAKPKAATTKAKPKTPTAKPKAAAKPNTRKA